MVEYTGILKGLRGGDAMVKAAHVEMLESHPIDPGRYLCVITGALAAVEVSVRAGIDAAHPESVIESFVLANLHEQILPVLRGESPVPPLDALGAIETDSAASIVQAADAACKASPVELFRLRLALHIGGKGYATFMGAVADIEAAVQAGGDTAGDKLIETLVIPNPYPEFYAHLCAEDGACPPLAPQVLEARKPGRQADS